jgi:hypothetical protein
MTNAANTVAIALIVAKYALPMHPSDLPWWGWALAAVAFWIAEVIVSTFTYRGPHETTPGAWIVRGVFYAAVFLCATFGLIRVFK